MFMFRLALKNMTRAPMRSVLSMTAIVAGIFVMLLGTGFVSGVKENIVRSQIDTVTGHVTLRPADYPTDPLAHPVDDLLELDAEAEAWLDRNTHAWTKRLSFTPEVIAGADGLRIRGVGFDPETDERVFPRRDWVLDEGGTWPTTAVDGVALAPTVAKLLEVKTGDWVTLKVRSHPGAINAVRVPVAAVFHSGSPYLDHATVFVPWELSQQLLLHEDKVSHVIVRLASRGNVAAFGEEAVRRVRDADFVTWESESADLLALQDIRQQFMNFITAILMAVSALSIANTILMAAYERIREVGTLRAMGMTKRDVIRMFVFEGALMGFVGALIGVALGGSLVYHWATQGIDLAPMIEDVGTETYANLPFNAMIYMDFSPPMLVFGALFGLVVSMAASVYPAIVASNMIPADAVRG